jgi:hypothetical protein
MASKQHCDRCDRVIGWGSENNPREAEEISGTFLADKGLPNDCGAIRVTAELTTFDGDSWNRVELCRECFEAAMDEFARKRRQYAEASCLS